MTDDVADVSASRFDRRAFPGLLRAARKAYGTAIRQAFADAGFDDMPRNGAYVLARVYDDDAHLATLTRELGISKQAVSQLIDVMVMRGYLERSSDSEDRRRMLLRSTPRGAAAATTAWEAATAVDDELLTRLSADGVAALRTGLIALCEIAAESESGAVEHD
ncbi:MAG TPA: MarR family transcriptional regulator [Streptosporangiaceae bacterium]|jgi:DNA-binding MarR family transcriptional regulator|nr:MarR family transcriptional regulator [Streptosporangiaceae bacterium]